MLYTTKFPMAIKGTRVEAGVEVELTEEDFGQFDRNDFEAVASKDVPEEVEIVPVDKMTGPQLKAKAEELGLPTTGTKADLLERISLHLEAQG